MLKRLNEEVKKAMKAKNKERLSVLRMILNEIKYSFCGTSSEVNPPKEPTNEELQKVIQGYHKKLTKAVAEYNRPQACDCNSQARNKEAQDKLKEEIKIIEEFLPKKASEEEIKKVIQEVMASNPENKDFGSLMKCSMAKLGSSADGKVVSSIIKSELGK